MSPGARAAIAGVIGLILLVLGNRVRGPDELMFGLSADFFAGFMTGGAIVLLIIALFLAVQLAGRGR